jgi:plasmid maintenance system antidote protein VapI
MRNLLTSLRSKTPEERVALALAIHVTPRTIENVVSGKSCGNKAARKIAKQMGHPEIWWHLVPDKEKL